MIQFTPLLGQSPSPAQAIVFLLGFLCVMLVLLTVGTLIGAILLRAACWIYNLMAGGPRSKDAVPDPSFARAMGIVLVALLVQMAIFFVIRWCTSGVARVGGNVNWMVVIGQLAAIPASFLAMAGMLTAMLPTTFGRASLVALLQIAVSLAIVAILLLIAFAVIGAAGFGMQG